MAAVAATSQAMVLVDIHIISQALLTMTSPEEALRALAVMHNYAPEEYKVCLGEGNISVSLSVLILSLILNNIVAHLRF